MRLSALRRAVVGMLITGGLAVTLAGCGSQSSQVVALNETGSSLLYPLFNLWVPVYTKAGLHAHVRITTQSSGSGTGISDAISGTVQIGASDAYMSDSQIAGAKSMLNIPLAISAQQIMYNVPGLNIQHLRISGPTLAGIYEGQITNWDNPEIAAENPGVRLPNLRIVPVHRVDGSGDTFLFSQYLSFTNRNSWGSLHGPQYGTTISWPPVPGGISGNGNAGMVSVIRQNPGGIGYVGISYLTEAVQAGLHYAALRNAAGNYVLPTAANIAAAAQAKFPSTPADERISLIYASGANSYPIINYEYAIVNGGQPNAAVARAIRQFLTWAIAPNSGNSETYLGQVHFLQLPTSVRALSQRQISEIK